VVRETIGDIFASDAEALVNPVNCVGVMGKGLALAFKKRFPRNFESYADACRVGMLRPGKVYVVPLWAKARPRYIINFPTKRHWREPSRSEDIAAGLADLVAVIREHDIRSVAIPALGCGLGGLSWQDVHQQITDAAAGIPDVDVTLYGPRSA
jgi:O-acetyl-ADP-ribose deacetylase (regulator of RNase III)